MVTDVHCPASKPPNSTFRSGRSSDVCDITHGHASKIVWLVDTFLLLTSFVRSRAPVLIPWGPIRVRLGPRHTGASCVPHAIDEFCDEFFDEFSMQLHVYESPWSLETMVIHTRIRGELLLCRECIRTLWTHLCMLCVTFTFTYVMFHHSWFDAGVRSAHAYAERQNRHIKHETSST